MDVGKENTYSLLIGVQTDVDTMETRVEFPQKAGNRSTRAVYNSAIPLLSTYPKDSIFYYRDTCSFMFIVALFTIAMK